MNRYLDSLQSDGVNFSDDQLEDGVHPGAHVHPDAQLGEDVKIGPFCSVGEHVSLGDGCVLKSHVVVTGHTRIGPGNVFFPNTAIGTVPQDLSYHGSDCVVEIGEENVFRESVTVNTGTEKDIERTEIGSSNLFMAYSHVAHDCIVGDDNVIANGVQLGGHVTIQNGVVFGGLAAVHHFVTIGRNAFVGGMSRLMKDVPPFMTTAGDPAQIRSLNSEGLRRNGFSEEDIEQLKTAHRQIFRSDGPRIKVLDQLKEEDDHTPEVRELIEFLERMRESPQGRAREVDRDF